jgi:hypothetical protein
MARNTRFDATIGSTRVTARTPLSQVCTFRTRANTSGTIDNKGGVRIRMGVFDRFVKLFTSIGRPARNLPTHSGASVIRMLALLLIEELR